MVGCVGVWVCVSICMCVCKCLVLISIILIFLCFVVYFTFNHKAFCRLFKSDGMSLGVSFMIY